ncbi:MAG: TRAP transporter large permease [Chloroflexota bacterium]|mgnify:CR=1 FL=1
MDPMVIFTLMMVVLFIGLLSGARVSMAMGLVALVSLGLLVPHPMLTTIAETFWGMAFSYILVCLPLFLLMGYLVSNTALSRYIFDFFSCWLQRLPGGAIHGVLAGTGLFGAATGSAPADAAALSVIAYPELRKRGYDISLSTGALAAGGMVGILMPPSTVMIWYAFFTGTSLGHLFMGGVLPAIIMVVAFVVTTMVIVKVNPSLAPKEPDIAAREKMRVTLRFIPVFVVIASVLMMIYTGVATPTEVSAVAVSLVLILALAYRSLTVQNLIQSLRETVLTGSAFLFIVACGLSFAFVIQYHDITGWIANALLSLGVDRYVILAGIYLILIVMGMMIEPISIIILTVPIMFPIVTSLGFDPLWFGVVYTILFQIAGITPPVGLNLYIVNGVCPGSSIEGIAKGALPYLGVMFGMLILCTVFPEIVLCVPRSMGWNWRP